MKTKHIGIIIIVLSIFLIGFSFTIHSHLDSIYLNQMRENIGTSCFLDDGTCLHENPLEWLFTFSYIIGSLMFMLGIFLLFDKTYLKISENLTKLSNDLRKVKEIDDEGRTFEYFLKGFTDDEKKLLRIIKQQEGIWQSTLRFKAGFSKGKLSEMLQNLEKKETIFRKKKGKTFELFIKA